MAQLIDLLLSIKSNTSVLYCAKYPVIEPTEKWNEKLLQNKTYHRRLVKRRSSTVEPVLGTLINHHNMRRINSRGMPQANKHIMMAALTYNLKKYLRFVVKKPSVLAQVVSLQQGKIYTDLKTLFHDLKSSFLSHPNFWILYRN